jgi:hypothetical protein
MHHVAGIAPLVTPEPDCRDHENQSEGGDQDEGGYQAKKEGADESAGNGSDGHSKYEQAVMAKGH